ncbi:MAG: type III pantothenate kinase [Deltaproteobacteria bacterium]|nr:type III pantothenate kinase [Deltaproteobacteria bacterium]
MLLVIDVGNTNTVLGVYDGDVLKHDWRIRTVPDHTVDEYGMLIYNLHMTSGIGTNDITAIIISCVVPPMLNILENICKKYFNIQPLVVGPGIKMGMPILYSNPKEVGADRIVNAVAAYDRWKRDMIIIDFGTAITFDYVSAKGEYMGGCISPGIGIAGEALFTRTAKLPRVEFTKPKNIVTKDTVSGIQAGLIFGFAGLVDGIIERMKAEIKGDPLVVATGGMARVVAAETRTIQIIDDNLTLEGLLLIYKLNK